MYVHILISCLFGDLQNIKKILMEDYNVEEEKDPQVRFYKTLWLDAEAALCSVNCMTRFINTKSEIEKSNFDDEKGYNFRFFFFERSFILSDTSCFILF